MSVGYQVKQISKSRSWTHVYYGLEMWVWKSGPKFDPATGVTKDWKTTRHYSAISPFVPDRSAIIPRPCSPIWDKWNGSSGQTPCPCPTCPTKIWRPPSPCSTCPTKIWRPPSPCPTCPTTPTCPNLSHLVVPLVFCQLSFLRFFFGFLSVIPFLEKHIWTKSFVQSTIMLLKV